VKIDYRIPIVDVNFDQSVWCPKTMLPELSTKQIIEKTYTIVSIREMTNKEIEDRLIVTSIVPEFSKKTKSKSLVLDFKGRVKMTSSKNFQMEYKFL
jgi:hypothetical protein